jgi:hypothetical protein
MGKTAVVLASARAVQACAAIFSEASYLGPLQNLYALFLVQRGSIEM